MFTERKIMEKFHHKILLLKKNQTNKIKLTINSANCT